MYYLEDDPNFEQRKEEWKLIEEAVLNFQKQFKEDATKEDVLIAKESATFLLERFSPLFKKYSNLLITGQIDWNDTEMKLFVRNFIDQRDLQRALTRKKQRAEYRSRIYQCFNFVKESYGAKEPEEILSDLQTLLLVLAKRYKVVGKNFCAYVYNCYRYEVYRHIKKFLKDPMNLPYKNLTYEDCINGHNDYNLEESYEDKYYEDVTGLPNNDWILGDGCSDIFSNLQTLDRNILVKYYLEEWKDKQIAEFFGMHINTVNQRRRSAAKQVADNLGFDLSAIKRTRRSGKNAILPTTI